MVEKQRRLRLAHRQLNRLRPTRSRPALARALAASVVLGAGAFVFWPRTSLEPRAPSPPAATPPLAPLAAPDAATPASATPPSPSATDPAAEEARHIEGFLAALVAAHPFGRDRQSVLRETLENAPPHAIESLLRVTFGDPELNDLTHVLIERLAALAPDAALAFAREKQLGAEPPWWHSVLGGLADPRRAAADLLALPPSDTRTGYLGHAALRISLVDTDSALDFARFSVPPEAREVALANAILGAARRDPAAGLALAAAHQAETGDAGLARSVAVDWAMDDYGAARRHILALPESPARQTALAGLAAVALERDPADAPALIAGIEDEQTRQTLLLRVRPAP